MMEKHTKYYCGYKNIKKIYLCNHNQETEGKIICRVSSQVNLRTEMSGTVPPKEVSVRARLCATRCYCQFTTLTYRGGERRDTLTHQFIEKQPRETDFEHPKQEPEWKVSIPLRKDGLFFGLRNK